VLSSGAKRQERTLTAALAAVRRIYWKCWARSIQERDALHKSRFSYLYGLSYEQRASDTAALLCSGHHHRCGHSDHLQSSL
jgi:succinate dehydrogenase flavin-adding protein (antitoxin of CptAB toxin-antitoxin module)